MASYQSLCVWRMGSVDVCLMFLCVCFLVVQGCQRAYGLDVSPPCIDMANQLVQEEGLQEKVRFFQVDATMDTVELWKQGMSALSCCCCCFACNAKSCTHKHTNALKTRVSIVGAPLFFQIPACLKHYPRQPSSFCTRIRRCSTS